MTTTTTLGERVRLLRERAKLTQMELADRSGISQRTISNIESGSQEETCQRLAALALSLHTTADFLLGLVVEPEGLSDGRWLIDVDEYERLQKGGKPQAETTWAAAVPSRFQVVTNQAYDRMQRALTSRKKK